MAKHTAKRQSGTENTYVTAGRTSDGVRLLEPAVGPKHFSRDEIRQTIEKVRSGRGNPVGARKTPR